MNHLHTLDVLLVIHPLHTEVECPIGLLIGLPNGLTLIKGASHSLLAKDVLTGRESIQHNGCVLVQGGGDNHTVNIFGLQQAVVVIIGASLGEELGCLSEVGLIVVAHGHHLGVRYEQQVVGVIHTPTACADEGHTRLVSANLLEFFRSTRCEPRGGGQQSRTAREVSEVADKLPQAQIYSL